MDKNILETVRDPLLILDQDLRVVAASRSFYARFRVSAEATIGVLVYELGDRQWDIPTLRHLLEEVLPKEMSFDDFAVDHDFPTLGHRSMLLNARQVRSYAGNGPALILLAIEDVTAEVNAKDEAAALLGRMIAARDEAAAATRLKDEFLATLSHELRTPLNAILGWAHLLQDGKLSVPDTSRAVATIVRNAQLQSQLIADMLDVSRIVAGKMRLDLRAVSMPPLIAATVDAATPAALAKNIEIKQLVDTQAPAITGDPDRLQQVLWNLLSNAIKFTPKDGRVQIRLELINFHVEITIEDTGPGIPPEFLPHVFDRFRQSDASSSRSKGGLGLGLAIARHLVELHGGTLSAHNRTDRSGAVFKIVLELRGVTTAAVLDSNNRHPHEEKPVWLDSAPSLDGIQVLVLDDEADARELLAKVLTHCGATVTTATTAREALIVVQHERPHVIVSDIEMPHEDGYAFMKMVRALDRNEGGLTPAVALTAYAGAQDRIKIFSAGFQVHTTKPIQPAELAAIVAGLTGTRR